MTSDPAVSQPRARLVAPLPPRVRMFHIGPAKTGTSSLQAAAAALRPELLEHGVRYPGRGPSQRAAVAAFLGRAIQYNAAKPGEMVRAQSRLPWVELMAELRSDQTNRIWFGHEYAAGASPEQVAAFAEEIGPALHVVLTLRSLTRMLPSIWQEYNKAGNTGTFDGFLKRMFTVPADRRDSVLFHVRHNHAGLVQRWANVVGIDNVTVVVADRSDHSFIKNAFEDLLDLPRELIANATIPARASNRTMSAPEIEMVRQINRVLREHGVPWSRYEALMLRGGLSRMLSQRKPGQGEPALRMSNWAAKQANAYQQDVVDGILASGVRIVGDPAQLMEPARARSSKQENHLGVQSVPLDAAVQVALGIISAASGRGPDFDEEQKWAAGLTARLSRAAVRLRDLSAGSARSAGARIRGTR